MAGYVFHVFEDVKVTRFEYRGSGEQDMDLDRQEEIIRGKEQIAGLFWVPGIILQTLYLLDLYFGNNDPIY